MRLSVVATAICLSIVGISTGTEAEAANRRPTHIAAQGLAPALQLLARERDVQVVYRSELVGDRQTSGAAGDLTFEEALTQLLKGTGLTFRYLDDKAITIIPLSSGRSSESNVVHSSQTPSAPQALNDAQTSDASTTRKPGLWDRFRLAQNDQTLEKSGSGQQQRIPQSSDQNSDSRVIEEVIVTGTSIRGPGPRSSPVLIQTHEEIERSGYSSAEQVIGSLPQNFAAGASEELFNTPRGASNFTEGSSVNLRGLGADSTLVLLDGRRLAPAGFGDFVDISIIPLTAVDRIEILTDGASAIYGSDAVGGVVNFRLRSNYSGLESRVRYGGVTEGSLDELRFGQAIGHVWEQGNALLSYEYFQRGSLDANDRVATEDTADPFDALPEHTRHSVFLNGSQRIGGNLEVFGNGFYSRRKFERHYFEEELGEPIKVFGESEQYGGTLGGAVSFGRDLRAELSTSYSGYEGRGDNESLVNPGVSLALNLNTAEAASMDLKLDGPLFPVPGGDAAAAFGGQYREEDFKKRVGGGGYRSFERDVAAGFAEVRFPIVGTANRRRGVNALELSAAVRYERYSDFGSSTDPKFGVLWSPTGSINIRGTYGTSFRAPQLNELDDSNLSPFLFDLASPTGTSLAMLKFGNNAALIPEESTHWTAGIDYGADGHAPVRVSLTYFDIDFEERIAEVPFNTGVLLNPDLAVIVDDSPDPAELAALAANSNFANFAGPGTNPLDAAYLVDFRLRNLSATRVNGVDFTLESQFEAGGSRLAVVANASYLLAFEDRLTELSRSIDTVDTVFNPPDLRLRAGGSWQRGALAVSLFANFTDAYEDNRFQPAIAVDEYVTADAQISYGFGSDSGALLGGLSISLSVLNAFDEEPPFVENTQPNGIDFDPENADILGRFVALELVKRW